MLRPDGQRYVYILYGYGPQLDNFIRVARLASRKADANPSQRLMASSSPGCKPIYSKIRATGAVLRGVFHCRHPVKAVA